MAKKPFSGRFAERMREAMEAKGLTLRDLSQSIDLTYEQCRKLSLGMSLPSRFSLPLICDTLDISRKEGEQLFAQDSAEAQGLSKIVAAAAGKVEGLEPIERVWTQLDDQDKQELIAMAQMKAKFARTPHKPLVHAKRA